MAFDYPAPLTGDTRRDLERLWEELFRLIEELRLLQEELARRDEQRDGSPVPYDDGRDGGPVPYGVRVPVPYGDQR